MKKKLLLFDFDGVIVASQHLSYSINLETIPDLQYEEWQSWFDGNFYVTVRDDLKDEGYQNWFFERYNKRVVDLVPYQDMRAIIEKLAKDFVLVIISSSTMEAIGNYLKKYEMTDFFDDVLARESHSGKVEKIEMAIKKYNANNDEVLLITDTVGDIKEAHEAGIKALAVIWGVHDQEKLASANPHFIAETPKEIITHIYSFY